MQLNSITNFKINYNQKIDFKINKHHNNPIEFKGTLNQDKFVPQDSFCEKEKARVGKKVDAKILEYRMAIEEAQNEIRKTDEKKEILFNLYQDEILYSQTNEYTAKHHTLKEELNGEIEKNELLISELNKRLAIKTITFDKDNYNKLKSLILQFDSGYESVFEQAEPNYSDLTILASQIKKNAEKEIKNKKRKITDSEKKVGNKLTEILLKYCNDNAIEVDDELISRYIKCLSDAKDDSFEEFKNSVNESYKPIYEDLRITINRNKNYIYSLKNEFIIYLRTLKNTPYLAPFYEPLLSLSETYEKLSENTQDFANLDNAYPKKILKTLEDMELLTPLSRYIRLYDLNDAQNKETIDILNSFKGEIKTKHQLAVEYHIPYEAIEKLSDKIIILKSKNKYKPVKELVLVDLSDENNIKAIQEEAKKAERLCPKASKYCYGDFFSQDNKEIPAANLQKMGFGNVALLRKLVQEGQIAGRVEVIQSAEGKKFRTYIDLKDSKTPKLLDKIRDNSPVSTISQFAKELGITQKKLIEHIKDGELDIIGEYLFEYDKDKKYIDKRTEKNKTFIEKMLFEKELAKQLKIEETQKLKQERIEKLDIQRKAQSLKMSLVWYFCPNTRNLASTMAVSDGHLCKLLVKDSQKEEELTPMESTKVNSYRKKMWELAGSDELKEGYKKADYILALYSKGGINAIEDEEIRKIIEMYQD